MPAAAVICAAFAIGGQPAQSEARTLRATFTYVIQNAKSLPAKRTILQTLLAFPKADHSRIAYINPTDKRIFPVTPKTLIQTQEITIEDGLDHMGRVARAQIGEFPAMFYKSTLAYHKQWMAKFWAGQDTSGLWKTFAKPSPSSPCVGFSVSMADATMTFSGREAVAAAKKAFGRPVKDSGKPALTTDDIGSYFGKWEMKDRFITVSQDESVGFLLRVIFKP
jgi:hypothetical protein